MSSPNRRAKPRADAASRRRKPGAEPAGPARRRPAPRAKQWAGASGRDPRGQAAGLRFSRTRTPFVLCDESGRERRRSPHRGSGGCVPEHETEHSGRRADGLRVRRLTWHELGAYPARTGQRGWKAELGRDPSAGSLLARARPARARPARARPARADLARGSAGAPRARGRIATCTQVPVASRHRECSSSSPMGS
jgi:hypothetical protein